MRLFWKIYLASLCSLLICAVLLTAIVSYREAKYTLGRLQAERRVLAITAASQLETGYYDQVWPFEMLSGLARGGDFVLWQIVDGGGNVVLSSAPGSSGPRIAVGDVSTPELVHTADDEEVWVVPLRVRDGPHPWQFRLGYHTRAVRAQMRSIVETNGLIGLLLAISLVGTSLYVTHRMLRPLNSLTRAVAEMERGRLDVLLPESGGDEIGRLVTGFSAMVRSIKERDAKIQEHLGLLEAARADLETRVEVRTHELHASEARTRAIIEYAADAIVTVNDAGAIELFNPAAARMFEYPASEVIGCRFASLVPACYTVRFDELSIESHESGTTVGPGMSTEIRGLRRDGESFPMQIALSQATIDGKRLYTAIVRDISERKRAEAEKLELHERLLMASRRAGMAEVASNVLHNVGNVLNSVNVSATLVGERLAASCVAALPKVTALIREHKDDLGEYLTRDERGKLLPAYLEALGKGLEEERRWLRDELGSLTRDIDHIRQIVKTQQTYAKVELDLSELVDLDELLDDAVRMASDGIAADVSREYHPTPQVRLDRHELVQILVNLIKNARQAVSRLGAAGRIRLRIATEGADAVRIEVIDNGVGIEPTNLARIFAHGFTTKRDGHGFGLHGAALSAKEMGGALSAHSDGIGRGARFGLVLPLEPSRG